MSNKNNKHITQDDNHADISDSHSHWVIFKRPASESTYPWAPPSPTLTSHLPELGEDALAVKNTNSNNHTKNNSKVRSKLN